jgi:hypothetical protein
MFVPQWKHTPSRHVTGISFCLILCGFLFNIARKGTASLAFEEQTIEALRTSLYTHHTCQNIPYKRTFLVRIGTHIDFTCLFGSIRKNMSLQLQLFSELGNKLQYQTIPGFTIDIKPEASHSYVTVRSIEGLHRIKEKKSKL